MLSFNGGGNKFTSVGNGTVVNSSMSGKEKVMCYKCNEMGHYAYECPLKRDAHGININANTNTNTSTPVKNNSLSDQRMHQKKQ